MSRLKSSSGFLQEVLSGTLASNTNDNKMLSAAQPDTIAVVKPWTVEASLDTIFKLDTVWIFGCDQVFDIIYISAKSMWSNVIKILTRMCP